jgi:NADPH:quinone reductase-like Zn-dependent oxidoreductase
MSAINTLDPVSPHTTNTNISPTSNTMQAITTSVYGTPDVLQFETVGKPVIGDSDILVRVHAASVCKGDVHLLRGTPYLVRLMGFGLLRPKHPIPGQSLAGRIETVGKNVKGFQAGDEVFGQVPHGAFAEYVCASPDQLAPKPTSLSYAQAAAIPDSGLTALQGLRAIGAIRPGHKVLINGASGGVGTFAVQIAKALGAHVTAVCSTRHIEVVRALGADHVVDYTQDDFTRRGRRYDILFDLAGNRLLADCKRVLNPSGVFVSSATKAGQNWIGPLVWMLKVVAAGALASQKMTPFIMQPRSEDLLALKRLAEAGDLTPHIERSYPLSQAAEAIRHIDQGHAQGKTVIEL